MDSTATGRPCVCILWRGRVSCPVSAAWHSCVAAHWSKYHCYKQAPSRYDLRCLKATLNPNKQTKMFWGIFFILQVVYMIWNAVNDPLFGYIQDNYDFSWVKTRRHCVLYGAPFFALGFLLPWFPWADYSNPDNSWICGAHLMFALCFYDTMFTFVLLAQCAIFTEMSKKQDDRVRLVRLESIPVSDRHEVFAIVYVCDYKHVRMCTKI